MPEYVAIVSHAEGIEVRGCVLERLVLKRIVVRFLKGGV